MDVLLLSAHTPSHKGKQAERDLIFRICFSILVFSSVPSDIGQDILFFLNERLQSSCSNRIGKNFPNKEVLLVCVSQPAAVAGDLTQSSTVALSLSQQHQGGGSISAQPNHQGLATMASACDNSTVQDCSGEDILVLTCSLLSPPPPSNPRVSLVFTLLMSFGSVRDHVSKEKCGFT